MTFKEFMKEIGYDLMTTFWEDFSIADKYGIAGNVAGKRHLTSFENGLKSLQRNMGIIILMAHTMM